MSDNYSGIKRRASRQIRVGSVAIGGDAPISVQSMTDTDTRDVQATVAEIEDVPILYSLDIDGSEGTTEHMCQRHPVIAFAYGLGVGFRRTDLAAEPVDQRSYPADMVVVAVGGDDDIQTAPGEDPLYPLGHHVIKACAGVDQDGHRGIDEVDAGIVWDI